MVWHSQGAPNKPLHHKPKNRRAVAVIHETFRSFLCGHARLNSLSCSERIGPISRRLDFLEEQDRLQGRQPARRYGRSVSQSAAITSTGWPGSRRDEFSCAPHAPKSRKGYFCVAFLPPSRFLCDKCSTRNTWSWGFPRANQPTTSIHVPYWRCHLLIGEKDVLISASSRKKSLPSFQTNPH